MTYKENAQKHSLQMLVYENYRLKTGMQCWWDIRKIIFI